MLLVANVQKDKQIEMSQKQNSNFGLEKLNVVRSEVPAITHVDWIVQELVAGALTTTARPMSLC